ncbi:helix-turn-helix domain-containing protein [Mycolicibacter algericus]|uniref:HTH araC/xylS-type domain-containing protein n=1 Tax=Mycolicibacter algericus TaxID=1288388 RepID=A0A7I9Y746_MYCAL|nr:helix-turn-helix domain-containing protein [Mycolicibacter algericus]GFG84505.1 hypothetical protein MALGJ_11810 [Mycolicibacter algericus]
MDLAIGDGYAVYRGPIGSGGPIHRHGAFQIVMSECGEVALVDPCGTRHQGPALVVAPMVPHRIIAAPDLVTYYIDPHCRFADRLRQRYQTGIAIAPELAQLRDQDIVDACRAPSHQLDPRLVAALALLDRVHISLPELAATLDVSPQRLRALARRELGMPLTRWRIWSRLRRAVGGLRSGMPMAEAAVAAGFSDQAHFTRQMQEMMGLTPSVVLQALGSHGFRAT